MHSCLPSVSLCVAPGVSGYRPWMGEFNTLDDLSSSFICSLGFYVFRVLGDFFIRAEWTKTEQ